MFDLYRAGCGDIEARVGTNGLTVRFGAADYFGRKQEGRPQGASPKLSAQVGDLTMSAPEFAAELMSVHGYVDGIVGDMARAAAARNPALTEGVKQSWTDFVRRWDAFYRTTAASVSSLAFPQLSGARTAMLRYSEEAKTWAQWLRDVGARSPRTPTSLPVPPEPFDWGSLNPLRTEASPFVWGLLVLGGLVTVVALKRS